MHSRFLLGLAMALAVGLALGGCGGGGKKAGTDYPAAGDDTFENTKATVHIEITPEGAAGPGGPLLQQLETVELEGPARIHRGDPQLDGDVYVVPTEIMEMELTGTASFGDVTVRESAEKPSTGEVRQRKKGEDSPADSFFDIFFEVDIPDLDMTLHNEEAMHMAAELHDLPPAEGDAYMGEDERPLYTAAGLQVGRIVDALHIPNPPPPGGGTEEPTSEGTQEPTEGAATATEPSGGGPEGGTYSVDIAVAEGGDPAGHQEFVEQAAPMPGELEVIVEDGTITIRGDAPFVEVTGTIGDDGSFTATGSGTVAGRPNVTVAFEGTLTDGTLAGTYALGVGGELPQQQAISYDVSGELA